MGEGDAYLEAARETGRWLADVAIETPAGVTWASGPDPAGVGISLYEGMSGPLWFLTLLHRVTADQRSRELVVSAAAWLNAELRRRPAELVAGQFAPYGLFTGIAGAALVLDDVASVAPESEAAAGRDLALELVRAGATVTPTGVHWTGWTEVVWGTAGTTLVLLDRGTSDDVALAERAGDWLVGQGEEAPGGTRWCIGPRTFELWNQAQPYMPNFSHGTAGIVFTLAELARRTGEERHLAAALAGARHLLAIADTDGGTCAVHHMDPGGLHLFPLGWCHGPTGLAGTFSHLAWVTGDRSWDDWAQRCARRVRASGIPERVEPGFWDNVARCCGSTGVAELFLDLHQAYGDVDALAFARLMTDDLLSRATSDASGTRWSNHEHRATPPDLPPETGFMQGASGIGAWLVRLGTYLNGTEVSLRLPYSTFALR